MSVDGGCADDIDMALPEACTNALNHGGPRHEYEVRLSIGQDHCTITVLDTGHGFDARLWHPGLEPPMEETAPASREGKPAQRVACGG